MPNGRKVPQDIMLDEAKQPKKVWIACQGLRPLVLPAPDAAPSFGVKAFEFMDSGYVADEWEIGNDVRFLLMAVPDATLRRIDYLLGWVDAKYVLETSQAIVDSETRILKKAMIVTSAETIADIRSGKQWQATAPVRYAPKADAAERDRYPWFSFFFVYAEVNDFVLLGSSPYFTSQTGENSPLNVVLGWIEAENLSRWNTREAYHWDRPSTLPSAQPTRRAQPGLIYRSPATAYRALRPNTNPLEGTLFAERFDAQGVSQEIMPQEARFPKLRWTGEPEFPAVNPLTNNRLIKVGWIGGFEGQDLQLSAQQIAQMQHALERIQTELGRTEILFVIDDSLSMLSWNRFARLADIVHQIQQDVANRTKGDVRIAVAYYNDESLTDTTHSPAVTCRLQDIRKGGDDIINELRDHQPAAGINADPREMVFHGIKQAISAAEFSDNARKMMLVLGDMGDKSDVGDVSAQREIVRRLMPDSPFPIEFYALQLIPPEVNHSDAKTFELQMQGIGDALRDAVSGASGQKRKVSGLYRTHDPDVVTKEILGRYAELDEQRLQLQSRVTRLMRGDWHTVIQPELEKWLESENFPVAELRRARGYQQFQEGWIWEYSLETRAKRTRQVNLWALLNRTEVEDLVDMLTRLTAESRGVTGVTLDQLLVQEIQRLAGDLGQEEIRQMTLADALAKRMGLDARTPLLNARVDQIDARFTRADLQTLIDRRNRLRDILDGQRSVWRRREERDEATGGVLVLFDRVGKPEPYDRTYTIPGSRSVWYWVNIAEELP